MKVYAISDFHLSINNPKPMDIFGEVWSNYLEEISDFWQKNICEEDLVLIAGDISWAMTLDAVKPDLSYLGAFKGKKVLLRGNHDYWWHSISALRGILPYNMYAVQNDCLRFGSVLVCGSRGWTTPENGIFTDEDKKIYDRELIRLKLSLDDLAKKRTPSDLAIAMMHYPPFNSKFEASPFTELMSEYKIDAVVYGHLHGKNARVKRMLNIRGVDYYLTSCDMINNEPALIAKV
ncbi:MAG: metallophosphoesterase [Christensenellales bacterium]